MLGGLPHSGMQIGNLPWKTRFSSYQPEYSQQGCR